MYGQRVGAGDGSSLFLSCLDTIFNTNGKGNAATELVENNGQSYTVFCDDIRSGKLWSYAEVIVYLLAECLAPGQLQNPSLEQLEVETDNQTVRDLDVTGLNLIEALHRCCQRIRLEFRFVSRQVMRGPRHGIVFYRPGRAREVELNCQYAKEQLSISKTNIATLHSKKNFWPVTHRYTGLGDFKVYEATFDLVKAWDPALEDTDYDKFSPSTNQDFYQVKDVYRKWCLNEAGDYSSDPYNQGEAFDFLQVFESANFIHRRRRFWPTLTTDKKGTSLGYFLQVSYDDGQHWWQYLYAFNNLLDECGIWLSSDQLDVDTWVAALKGVLKFRITASVVSDERLSCTIADGPVGSATEVVDHIIQLRRRFKFRKVSGKSIFANVTDDNIGTPDEVNDTAALSSYLRQVAGESSAVIENIDIQTPLVIFDYRPGDKVISSPESRDYLGCKLDNRSIYWIERVQMDFVHQCTRLFIARRRN